jgi:hypothetical protein
MMMALFVSNSGKGRPDCKAIQERCGSRASLYHTQRSER